jgi:hypothetical protein
MPKKNEPQANGSELPPAAESITGGEATPATRERPGPERIADRAYERFRMRGGEHGRDQEDWFDAERDLTDRPDE